MNTTGREFSVTLARENWVTLDTQWPTCRRVSTTAGRAVMGRLPATRPRLS